MKTGLPSELEVLLCETCALQECDDAVNPESSEQPRGPHCPHAWWDSECGTWREAQDDAPFCAAYRPKITTRAGADAPRAQDNAPADADA